MNTHTKNQSVLISSIKFLTRAHKQFFLIFFGIATALYVLAFIVVSKWSNVSVNGIADGYVIVCLVAGLVRFRESFVFLTQNQVPKSTITKTFIIEGLCFGLFSGFLMNIFSHLMQTIASALSVSIPSLLNLLPADGPIGFGKSFVMLSLLYIAVYFFGLMLSTINYRLNWLGRTIFWIAFGIVGFNALIGSIEVVLDNTAPENLDVPSVILAKPFIYGLIWLRQSFGNFVIGSVAVVAVFLAVWVLSFRGAEIKYSKTGA